MFWVGTSKKSVAYKLIMKKKKSFLIKYNDFIKKSEDDGFFISSKVNKYFWHSRLSSAFVFSALFNIPDAKYKNSKIYNFIFLTMLGSDIFDRNNLINQKERILIKKLYFNNIRSSKFSFFFIYVFAILLFVAKSIKKIFVSFYLKIKYFFYKKFYPDKYFYSTDRKKFKNIFLASQLN